MWAAIAQPNCALRAGCRRLTSWKIRRAAPAQSGIGEIRHGGNRLVLAHVIQGRGIAQCAFQHIVLHALAFQRGDRRDYWIKEIRHCEMELVANAEASYTHMVEALRDKPLKPKPT